MIATLDLSMVIEWYHLIKKIINHTMNRSRYLFKIHKVHYFIYLFIYFILGIFPQPMLGD